jgi:plastocyanin
MPELAVCNRFSRQQLSFAIANCAIAYSDCAFAYSVEVFGPMQKKVNLFVAATILTGVAMLAGVAILAIHAGAAGAKQDGNVITVRMEGKKFVPEQITVHSGDTVEWVNEPNGRKHQVTTDPQQAMEASSVSIPKNAKPFDSGTVKPGEAYRYKFTVAGTYRYSCPPHEMSGMVGTVVVEP